jgi:hypothetical protein
VNETRPYIADTTPANTQKASLIAASVASATEIFDAETEALAVQSRAVQVDGVKARVESVYGCSV